MRTDCQSGRQNQKFPNPHPCPLQHTAKCRRVISLYLPFRRLRREKLHFSSDRQVNLIFLLQVGILKHYNFDRIRQLLNVLNLFRSLKCTSYHLRPVQNCGSSWHTATSTHGNWRLHFILTPPLASSNPKWAIPGLLAHRVAMQSIQKGAKSNSTIPACCLFCDD